MLRWLVVLAVLACPLAHASEVLEPFQFGPRLVPKKIETDPLVLRRDTLSLSIAFAQGQAPRPGAWWEAERALFTEVAASGKYDLLVAPVQSDGYALDRISRSLITAHLIAAVRERGHRVPGPYVVQRALGDGRRDLQHLAGELGRRLGVQRIVAVYASHDRAGRLLLSVRVDEKRTTPTPYMQPGLVQQLAPIDLPENRHPVEVVREALPQILGAARIEAAPRPASAMARAGSGLPASPAAAIAPGVADAEAVASALQLMATLAAPYTAERARERLFERALLAALALPEGNPRAVLFKARAWRHLESRTAAMRALEKSRRPEALAYRQLLDGNLPEFGAALAKVDDRFSRLLLEIDLAGLKHAYDAPQPVSEALIELARQFPGWLGPIGQRLSEFDRWSTGDPTLPWRLLEQGLPLAGAGLEDHVRGLSAIGRTPDMASVGKGTLAHLRRLYREDAALRRCLDESVYCARGAYLDLVESMLVSSLERFALLRGRQQALPEEALQFLRSLEPEFEGQVDLALAGAAVLLDKARGGREPERRADLAKVREAAATVAWLEQGASRTAHQALAYMAVGSPVSLPYLEAYFHDLPVRSYWYLHGGNATLGSPPGKEELVRNLRARVDEAVIEIDVAVDMRAWTGADLQRGDVLEQRFHGHPARLQLLAMRKGGKASAADVADERVRQLEAAVRERPDRWEGHRDLAMYHLRERGDYAAAAGAFMAFPGFKSREGYGAVALSNQAYEAGSEFFWRGRSDEARKFYQIAAELDTGSGGSITSQARLAILDGDFRAATALQHSRAQRYGDPYGYRDYLAWLFAFGFRDEAWAGFGQLHQAIRNPQVWLAADVGHRIAGRSWPEVRQWLLSEPFKSSSVNRDRHALRLAIQQSSVGRAPAADLGATLRAIEGAPVAEAERTQDGKGALLVPHSMSDGNMILRRSQFRLSERTPLKEGERVASHFVLFGDAYVALRGGDYAAAVEKFDTMAAYYPIEGQVGFDAYALPYFAWASARSGDKLGLEAFVRGQNPRAFAFDRDLALAFFSGLKGDHEAALAHLKHAFDVRPHTERRPIPTEYQWAEACEWLFEATKERRYLDVALRWARVHQRIQPMMSWAYAMEAKHAADGAERLRALGIALYLDPRSERIAGLPEDLKRRARQDFERNNPFDPRRAKPVGT
jgi:hypothetical protein